MNKVLGALVAVLAVVVVVLLVLVVGLRGDVRELRNDQRAASAAASDLERQVEAIPTEVPTPAAAEDTTELRADVARASQRLRVICMDAQLEAFFSNLEGQQLARGYDQSSSSYFSTLYSLVYAVCGLPKGA